MPRRLNWRSSLQTAAIALCLACVALTSCGSAVSVPKDAREVTVAALQTSQPESVLFIDVRTPAEYARDRIGESPLIPISDIETGAGVEAVRAAIAHYASEDQPVTVILYCERGFRSARAQKKLAEEGIPSISMAGGIRAWRERTPRNRDREVLQKLRPVSLNQN